jgi:TRAP-type C4-dicarboxylate transport system permease small subunit
MLRSIVALNAVLENLLQIACGLLGIEITLLMFAQVLIRYFGDEPLSWSEEVIRYSFMWCAFLGAALAQRYRWHVALEVLEVYPQYLRGPLKALTSFILIAFLGIIAFSGLKFALLSWGVASVALQWPMAYAYGCVPVAAFAMVCFAIEDAFRERPAQPL